jgi:hypothetical protein
VGFYQGGPRCPEDIDFPSVMRAVMEYLGENIGCNHCSPPGPNWGLRCSYGYFCGVTGIAFLTAWKPGWQEDNFTPENLPGEPGDMVRRAFEAIGYGYEIVTRDAGEAAYREKLKDSIRERGRPAIGFGIIGPPAAALITGYDEDGDVLTGWSFFQNEPAFAQGVEYEPSDSGVPAYFRKRDWFASIQDLVLVGEKGPKPDQGQVCEKGLKLALEVIRTPEVRGVTTGLAAYSAWAADLLRDEDFPLDQEAILQQRHRAHDFGVGSLAEGRWYGAQWLLGAFEKVHYDAAEPLLKAAGCFAAEHELMWKLWNLAGGIGSPEAWRKFADPRVRREMHPIILQAQAKEAEAAGLIEEALGKLVASRPQES